MTNRIELNWKLDGAVDEQRYYCSETPINVNSLPAPKVVLAGDIRSYVDAAVEFGKTYYVAVGSVKNSIEKLSPQVRVSTSRLTKSIKALFSASEKGGAYNFQDLSTLWQDVEATIPITAVDQFIARADDISGNGNHLIQANAAKRPQLKQDAVGFYAWFDGSKAVQTASVVDLAGLMQFTTFLRASRERPSIDEAVFETSNNYNNNAGAIICFFNSANKIEFASRGTSGYAYADTATAAAADAIYTASFNLSAASNKVQIRKNGTVATVDTRYDASNHALTNYILYVGGRSASNYYAQTKMRALVLLGRTTTTQEVENIEQQLDI